MRHLDSTANECRMRTSHHRSRMLPQNTTSLMIWSIMAQKDTCNLRIHPSSGPLPVCLAEAPVRYLLTLLAENMVEATKELGISISYDQANGDAIGGFYCPHNQDPATQTRSSAQEAYYETAQTRSNFELTSGHRVTRVVTSSDSGSVRVTGLEVSPLGKRKCQSMCLTYTSLVRFLEQCNTPLRFRQTRGHPCRGNHSHSSAPPGLGYWGSTTSC